MTEQSSREKRICGAPPSAVTMSLSKQERDAPVAVAGGSRGQHALSLLHEQADSHVSVSIESGDRWSTGVTGTVPASSCQVTGAGCVQGAGCDSLQFLCCPGSHPLGSPAHVSPWPGKATQPVTASCRRPCTGSCPAEIPAVARHPWHGLAPLKPAHILVLGESKGEECRCGRDTRHHRPSRGRALHPDHDGEISETPPTVSGGPNRALEKDTDPPLPPGPMNVTVLGNRVLAAVINRQSQESRGPSKGRDIWTERHMEGEARGQEPWDPPAAGGSKEGAPGENAPLGLCTQAHGPQFHVPITPQQQDTGQDPAQDLADTQPRAQH